MERAQQRGSGMVGIVGGVGPPRGDEVRLLRLHVLGPLAVSERGRALDDLPSRTRAALALLALHPGRARSDREVIELVWPGAPPLDPERSLRRLMRPLRGALGDVLVRGRATWRLDVPPDQFDEYEFQALVVEAERHLARRDRRAAERQLTVALRLWRGAPYPELDHWPAATVVVERLQRRRLDAVEHQMALRLWRSQEDPMLPADLWALVRRHPQRERLWRELASALYLAGQRTAALRALDECRDELRSWGLVPSSEFAHLQSLLYTDVADPSVLRAIA